MDHLEEENHKLREEVTTLRAENEILRNLVSLMTMAQRQPLSHPVVSTQAQTVASTTPISTVFASSPQQAMLEGYLWGTPFGSSEVFRPDDSKVQAPFVQLTTPIPQPVPLFPQAAMIHTTQQGHKPIYHSGKVVAYDRTAELEERFDRIQLELKTLRGKELFGKNAYDLCLVPNVVIPPKFKVPNFEKYQGNTCPELHLVMYVRKMSAQVGNDGLLIHCFQDSLTGAALIWYMGLHKVDIKTFNDLCEAFVQRYNYNLHLAPNRKELQAMTMNDNESFKAYAQRWRDVAAQVRPPLEEKEFTEIFLETLDQFYYEHMLTSASGSFVNMMTVGMRIEEWVRKGRLVKESAPTDDFEYEDQEMSVVESQPQQQYLAYHPAAAVMPIIDVVQSSGYQPQFQQYQQQPRQQAPRTQIDPIPMKYADLFPKLLERNLVYTKAPPPMPAKLTSRYRPDLFCAFHQGAPGHDIEHCFALQKVVQKLIQKNLIPFEEFEFEYAS
ncbi:uncharacterized protein [Medicago truncatula]|uniref:uncharacterized protein n=1 Tax=Medicago truncatula TaxID=3880 RepID=UPI001967DECD|nr:uncharacterized protein LOC120578399 [Medicago truncatula]